MSEMTILLNPSTEKAISAFAKHPSHAVMLEGPSGSGKMAAAEHLATVLLGLKSIEALRSYPYLTRLSLEPKQTEIPIEAIRKVIHAAQLKTPSKNAGINRVTIIEDAQLLSLPAQNALLKILEEPPADMLIVLTCTNQNQVLPTITSRTFVIPVTPVPLKIAQERLSIYESREVESMWRLAQGRAGLLIALLGSAEDHQLKTAINVAKSLLSQDSYGRLRRLEEAASQNDFIELLEGLDKVLGALQRVAINRGNRKQSLRILSDRKLVNKLRVAAKSKANLRLMQLELAMMLKL